MTRISSEFPYRVLVRNSALQTIGHIEDFQKLTLVPRWNDIGTWSIDIDRRSRWAADLTTPGYGIIVIHKESGKTVLSGPANQREHSVTRAQQRIVISGLDDNVWLNRRWAHASPTESFPPYTVQAEDVRTGVCSTVLRAYVNANMGPGAIATRRKTVTLGIDPTVGSSVTGRGRFQMLIALLQELAKAGGDVGFRLAQVGTVLEFQTFLATDRTTTVKFSQALGNLAEFKYSSTTPTANYALVGGPGTGTGRTFLEKSDSAAIATWERIEGELIDQSSATTTAEQDQAATSFLTEHNEQATLSLTPIELPNCRFGTHYFLGDKVTVQIEGPSGQFQDVIREVKVELTPQGPQSVTPLVGTGATRQDTFRLFRVFRQLARRVGYAERR